MKINRRHAITLGTSALAGCVTPGFFRRGYIDAHSHIWTNDVKRFPLAPGQTVEDLQPRSFTDDDLIKLGITENVTRHVLISHGLYHGYSNDYYIHAVAKHPGVFAVVGALNPALGRIFERMQANLKLGISGYRIKPNGDANWLKTDAMQAMWKTGASNRIAMCPLIDPQYIAGLDPMCKQFPDTTVVIDHCARIDTQHDAELNHLCALSKHPNVNVKVSAFYAFGAKQPPYLEQVSKIKQLYEAFGPERLMWASDCPYQLENGNTYSASIALVRDRLNFLNTNDKDWILRRTAEKAFFS